MFWVFTLFFLSIVIHAMLLAAYFVAGNGSVTIHDIH